MLAALIMLVLCLFTFLNIKLKKTKNLPPGPPPIPLLGNILDFINTKGLQVTVHNLKKTYGDILTLYIGPFPLILLQGQKVSRKFLGQGGCRKERKSSVILAHLGGDGKERGLLGPWSLHTEEQRKFIIRHLKANSIGIDKLESLILARVNELFDDMNSKNEKSLTFDENMATRFSFSVIWSVFTGNEMRLNDEWIKNANEQRARFLKRSFWIELVINFLPFDTLKKWWIPYPREFPEIIQSMTRRYINSFKNQSETEIKLEENAKLYNNNNNNPESSFFSKYFDRICETKDPNSSFYSQEGVINMEVMSIQLLVAVDSVGALISASLHHLAENPLVQERVFEEIDLVVGKERTVSLKDRHRMIYCHALVHEILRLASVITLGVTYETLEECDLETYTLPKGSYVTMNQYSIAMDEEVFKNPHQLDPARFIYKDESSLINTTESVSFGLGSRLCPAESLIRDLVFIFTTNLCQRYKLSTTPAKVKMTPIKEFFHNNQYPIRFPATKEIFFSCR